MFGKTNPLIIDPEKGKEVAVILFEKFNSSEGIFGHNVMPEDLLPTWGSDLTVSGVNRGSYEHLMFITLVVSIDYQRNADQLWEAGRKTFEDKRTRWLFYPKDLVNRTFDEIVETMRIHRLSKKPRKDAEIWLKVSKSIFEIYDSNPLNIIKECDYDALKVYNKKFDQKFKRSFPYFSGDKIFPLWIRMLHDNVGIELTNLDKIPIPVDVHVARATFTTGCLKGRYIGTISNIAPKINDAWDKTIALVQHTKLRYKLQMDEPLWHLSKYGCTFRKDDFCLKRTKCPVSRFCVKGIVRVSAEKVEVDTGDRSDEKPLNSFMFRKQR